MSGWRRFERVSSEGGRFWAIRTVGSVCELRFGAIDGDSATPERLEHDSEAAAKRTAKQKIRNKQRGGWIEVDVGNRPRGPVLDSGEALEQAIAEDPSNVDNWAVYADFLLGSEPSLGERVALGLALADAATEAKRERLRVQIDALERDSEQAWFGRRLAPILGELVHEGSVELDRRFGMIVGATLRDPKREGLDVGALLRVVLESPLARALAQLRVEADATAFVPVVGSIIERRPSTLRRLALIHTGGIRAHRMSPPDKIQTLLDRMPRLERLELHGDLRGRATHASLRELRVVRADHNRNWPFERWRLPALERLHVDANFAIDWRRIELPRLRRLLVSGHGDVAIERLLATPLLSQLDSLVLDDSWMSPAAVETILAHVDRFVAIPQLAFFGMYIDAPLRQRLAHALPHALLRTADEMRRAFNLEAQPDPILLEHRRATKF